MHEPYYKELHAADGSLYIEKREAHRWDVRHHGRLVTTWETRRDARVHARAIKRGGGDKWVNQ